MPYKSRKKPGKITIRFKDCEQHELVSDAAKIEDTSVNKFVIRKAVAAAKEIIKKQQSETQGA